MNAKEKARARANRWYKANRDKALANMKAWRKKHPGYGTEAGRKWRKAHPEESKQKQKLYRKKNAKTIRQYQKQWARINRTGIRIQLLEEQGGSCAICGVKHPGGHGVWNTDHDHKSKKIRGILCANCNCGLGHFKDKPELLEKAAVYLTKNGG